MSGFGSTPTTTTESPLATDQVYISSVATPNTANGDLTALEGGPISTDSNSNKTAPASIYVKDGSDITQGAKADTAITDAATTNTKMSFLKGLVKILADIWDNTNHRIRVDGSGVTQPVSLASLPVLPAGTNVIGHVVVDSAGNVTVTSLPSLPAGTNVIGHVIVDSGAISLSAALPAGSNTIGGVKLVDTGGTNQLAIDSGGKIGVNSLPALPAGSNVIGHIVVDSGSIGITSLPALPTGSNVIGHVVIDNGTLAVTQSGTWNVSTQQSNITADYDTGAGSQTTTMFGVALPASGGAVPGGTSSNPLRTDPTGATIQPVSASSLPLPSGAAQEAGNLATIVTNTNKIPASPATEGGHLATIDTSTAASKTDLDTLAGIVSSGKAATKAAANDIVDLATLLALAGTSGDANTVASLMGRLTKIRDLLTATLTVQGTITEANSAASKADLDTIVTNTGHIPASPAQEGGNLATLVPGVQGWIAATGTGTASQDDALTFSQQVRKIALYNASANNVPLEFDQTAAATSFPIPPGAFWIIDDALCTAVHVFPSATLPINTTSGLYVKGWK